MACLNDTEGMQLLCGGCAHRDKLADGTRNKTNVLRLGASAGEVHCACINAHGRRRDSLMTQMTDRAGVRGGKVGMSMPSHSKCGSYHQRENRHGDQQTSDFLLIRHLEAHLKDTAQGQNSLAHAGDSGKFGALSNSGRLMRTEYIRSTNVSCWSLMRLRSPGKTKDRRFHQKIMELSLPWQ